MEYRLILDLRFVKASLALQDTSRTTRQVPSSTRFMSKQTQRAPLTLLSSKSKSLSDACGRPAAREPLQSWIKQDIDNKSRYKDKAAFDSHVGTDTFKGLGEAIQKEDLLAKPLDIKFVNKVAGFLSR